MSSVLLQSIFFGFAIILLLINRTHITHPTYPLLGLGAIVAIWLLYAAYVLLRYLWLITQGELMINHSILLSSTLALLPIILVAMLIVASQRVPPIHDVSTDTDNPPKFIFARQLRHAAHNPLDYDEANKAQQKQAYPQLQTIKIQQPLSTVAERVTDMMSELGWQYHGQQQEGRTLLIEAADQSTVFGFIDDVVVRLRASENGGNVTLVDIRSASRVGKSDLGANAKRIEVFINMLSSMNQS